MVWLALWNVITQLESPGCTYERSLRTLWREKVLPQISLAVETPHLPVLPAAAQHFATAKVDLSQV